MATFEGRKKCDCCGKPVDVYTDKAGKAYYNCGPCGVRVIHRAARTTAAVIAALDKETESDDGAKAPQAAPAAPAPAARPEPRPAPRVTVAPPVVPPKPAPAVKDAPPPAKKAGFFSQLSL